MNKIAIPALLVATVMVAGMFAFAPVEQASTVHATGTATLAAPTTQVFSFDVDVTDANTGDIVTLDCTGPYIVTGMTAVYAAFDAGDDIEVSVQGDTIVDIDGVLASESLMTVQGGYTTHGGDLNEDILITFTDTDTGGDEDVTLEVTLLGATDLTCLFTQTTDA